MSQEEEKLPVIVQVIISFTTVTFIFCALVLVCFFGLLGMSDGHVSALIPWSFFILIIGFVSSAILIARKKSMGIIIFTLIAVSLFIAYIFTAKGHYIEAIWQPILLIFFTWILWSIEEYFD